MTILSVNNLSKHFGGLQVVNDLSFHVNKGEILGLIGTNGAGKTTTFNLISGFIKPASGQILFNGTDITNLPPHKIAKMGLIRTFQHTSLFLNLTVFDNIHYALNGINTSSIRSIDWVFKTKKYKKTVEEQVRKVTDLLRQTELEDIKDLKAGSLSYGDQRILSIAVALTASPNMIMLDEPAAGLNPKESSKLTSLIKSIVKEGISVVIVEHDMKVVMNLSDKIVVMDHGSKIAEGKPDEIKNNKTVIEVYLGTDVGVV